MVFEQVEKGLAAGDSLLMVLITQFVGYPHGTDLSEEYLFSEDMLYCHLGEL